MSVGCLDDAFGVVLADDHHFFREGLRALLESGGMRVLGEAADGPRAVALAREHSPDLVVLELDLPGCSSLDVLQQIASFDPGVRGVVLTVSSDARDVLAALAAGAGGYLLKDMRSDCLVAAIRQAAAGQMVLAHEVGGRLAARMRGGAGTVADGVALTPRETEVLRLIADGANNVAIGHELSISPNTVKQYVTNIFEKLGVRSRVQAAVHAVRVGLV
jgi:two-component system nitrate/nitrite response regulator NarL